MVLFFLIISVPENFLGLSSIVNLMLLWYFFVPNCRGGGGGGKGWYFFYSSVKWGVIHSHPLK